MRDLMAWPLAPDDRAFVERLRRKEAAGEDSNPEEERRLEAIWRAARPKVHDEAAERRLKLDQPVEAIFADLDKWLAGK